MNVIQMSIFAAALNLDIMIVSINMGTRLKKYSEIPALALIISLLQSFIPVIGYLMGNVLNKSFGPISKYIGSIILIATGIKIILDAIKEPGGKGIQTDFYFAFLGAGIEDLMSGVSLGSIGEKITLFMFIFFLVAFIMNFVALRIGAALRRHINFSMDFITGICLVVLGLLLLFDVF